MEIRNNCKTGHGKNGNGSTKCTKMSNARAGRAKLLFFIVKYADLRCSCHGCRRASLNSLGKMNNARAKRGKLLFFIVKAMLHEAIFLATCNATMTNKKPFKLQRGCYTQATCLATLRKVEGRSTFLATRNARIAVAKCGVTREFFLATCNATFVALQVARKIASCNMAFK